MRFLRVWLNTTLNPWDNKEDEALAKDVFREAFGDKGDCPSLYWIDSLADEFRTAAAFALTTTKTTLANFFVVRLFQRDLDKFDLQVDDDGPGTTGVVDVDFRHFEIRNLTQVKAVALTAWLRNTASEGEERFRWVATRFQRPQLVRFLQLPDEQVIAEAKRRCRVRLGCGGPADSNGRSIPQIISDLHTNKPTLPRFRVERAAYLNYCDRIRNSRSGSSGEDWTTGEESLREAYKNAFR
ncbi:MAG: hypothetical protein L0Z62_44930 [Gemmataceae bacterium]|nr:hypothetical protein [Gemmataceae bacterium]